MAIHWFDGKIIDITDLTSMTRSFVVEIQDIDVFDFLPGQFVTLDLPVGDKRAQRWRSYSIASRPMGNNLIEFCIVLNPQGLGTPYLFELKKGDMVKFKGPDGGFVLPTDLSKEIVMVCTGTGIAPFKSMIDHLIHQSLHFERIHLIFGTRHAHDILYKDHFQQLATNHANFKFDIALSREKIENVHHGYVHDIYMDQYNNRIDERLFLLCGWSGMIDQAVANLIIEKKYSPNQVKYELYG